jgi:hypothetical protein
VTPLATIRFEWDWGFVALLPAINFNLHSGALEFEWLCLGIYCDLGVGRADG